jgi:hypothetical protein
MNKARPDAVIEELTSLPKHYTPEEMRAAKGELRFAPRRLEWLTKRGPAT